MSREVGVEVGVKVCVGAGRFLLPFALPCTLLLLVVFVAVVIAVVFVALCLFLFLLLLLVIRLGDVDRRSLLLQLGNPLPTNRSAKRHTAND